MAENYLRAATRYSALAGIVLTWPLFIVGMVRTGLSLFDGRPLSYLGVSSFKPYFLAGIIAGIFFMAAFYVYIRKTFIPAPAFKAAFLIGLLAQAIVAATPYQLSGRFQGLHWTAASVLAIALIALPWLFAGSKRISSSAARISKGVTITYLGVLVLETILLVRLNYYVVSELVNLLIFHSWLIYLTFLPDASKQANSFSAARQNTALYSHKPSF